MEMTIADVVEELCSQLAWSNEANALGDVECDYDDDDMQGWLTMGPVEVTWVRDPYGDGNTKWVAVSVTYDGAQMDDVEDYGPELDDAVRAAARRTDAWQEYRADEIRDEIIEWLDSRCEDYDVLGPQDDEPGDAWTITWREATIRGYFTKEDGALVWSMSNSETADYIDGDADSTDDDVIEAIERIATDPMVEAWIETINELTAEDDWSMRVSDDGLTVWMSEPTDMMTRRATYEWVGFGEGRIEMEYLLRIGEWRAVDEYLPEDEDDVRRMAREAYEWVKAVSD